MNQNTQTPNTRSNFGSAFKGNGTSSNKRKGPTERIFMQVHSIESYSDFPTVAYGYNLKTKQKIAIRLTTTVERIEDLQRIYKNMTPTQAQQRARAEYQGSNKRESLDDKRDKRHARFLSFDHCVALQPLEDGTPFYRAHWSELLSSNSCCTIFEGMAHLYVNKEKNIALLKVIEFISDLQLGNAERNHKIVLNTLKNQFKNGLKRMGSCVVQVIDSHNSVISESSIYQASHKEPASNKDGDQFDITVLANEFESINAFMGHKEQDPKPYHVDIDLARVGLSVLAGIPFEMRNLCYSSAEYIQTMQDSKTKFESGEFSIRIVSLNEIFCGPERKKSLILKANNKSIISNYTKQELVESDDPNEPAFERSIALYMPTVFALHYHRDSGNPFIAYNIISEQFSTFTPAQLWQMPKDLSGFKYRILHDDMNS